MSDPAPGRLLAVGDIHGCAHALDLLLADINPHGADRIVALGDYVDRGPDSRGVLDRLIALHRRGLLIPLRGNHELMMLRARDGREESRYWMTFGGAETLDSYDAPGRAALLDDVPELHWHFLEDLCHNYYDAETHFFVHANADPALPLDQQPERELQWNGFDDRGPHCSGKVMVCGHTQQASGWPRSTEHAVCIDTHAYGGGWLTCLDVATGHFWQANERGQRRTGNLADLIPH
ncbi:MAG: metallophosphoesterase family protein [Gemmataceae bacterium]